MTRTAKPTFGNYREFWPYYVAMHSKAATRRMHFAGTLLGALVAAVGVLRGRRTMIAAWPAIAYSFAWPSHWFIEHNNPATFGHPLWSLRGDFEMISYMLRGRDRELSEIATNWLASHPSRPVADWTLDKAA